ncbi:MAG: hypothetical protein KC492_39430, partial [Myxococcales bacterium]|nr:hypothetical protein [Myxococcales bacterium]
MSNKLSLHRIAATLAVLSASGLVACGGDAMPEPESPVDAQEVPAAEATEAPMEGAADEATGSEGGEATEDTAAPEGDGAMDGESKAEGADGEKKEEAKKEE